MDTSLLDCDVQPSYVRVTLKGKIFQLTLWKEVNCDASTAKRSQISGNLLITMPFANPIIKKSKSKKETATRTTDSEMTSNPVNSDNQCNNKENETQFLEVDSSSAKLVDLNVVDQNEKVSRKNAPYKPKSSAIYSGVVEKDSKVIDLPDDLPPLDDFGF